MHKHYVYRINGIGWHITENHHTMHEMSGSHDGANSDFFVLFFGLNYHHPETTTKIIKHVLTSLASSLRSNTNPNWVVWKFLHCYCMKYVKCMVDQVPKLCIFDLKNYDLVTNS